MRTGYYFRVRRDGKFQSLDIAELSEEEVRAVFADKPTDQRLEWLVALAKFIKQITPLYQDVDTMPSREDSR